jgi:hypothetical protein
MDELNKLDAFVESALELIRQQRAEEAVKEVAAKLAVAERNALLVADMRKFVEGVLPAELLASVRYPPAQDIVLGYPHLDIDVPGCVPVKLGLRYNAKTKEFFMAEDAPFSVPALEISAPFGDEEEIVEGSAEFTWSRVTGQYQRINCADARTAIGIARERWIALGEAQAENQRLSDELKASLHEKTMAKMRELYNLGARKAEGEAEYVPVVEDKTPCEIFNQALREYVYNLVDQAMRTGRE